MAPAAAQQSIQARTALMARCLPAPLPAPQVRAPRKAVLVVVTSALRVLCYDHNLRKLWEQDLAVGRGLRAEPGQGGALGIARGRPLLFKEAEVEMGR